MSWSRRFEDPIKLPSGKTLRTLRDAADYIQKLPAKEAEKRHWQTAIRELLISAERGGIILLAQWAMLQAIHHDDPEPEKPRRRKRAKAYRIVR